MSVFLRDLSSVSESLFLNLLILLLLTPILFLGCDDEGESHVGGDSDADTPSLDGDEESQDTDGDEMEGDRDLENDIEMEVEEESVDEEPWPDVEPTRFFVGYGESDCTPPNGTALGGFGAPGGGRVIEGVHDPLMGQAALFVNDAERAYLVISLDTAGFGFDFGDWGPGVMQMRQVIAEALRDRVRLYPEHILIASSHSHAATDLVGFWQAPDEGVPLAALNVIQDGLVAAAEQAADTLQEASLYTGATELVGYTGRDSGCSEIIDNTVGVLQARDGDGHAIVTLANYAKHPTMLGDGNRLASADFIWGYREELGSLTGAPAMYLQGFVAAVHGGSVGPEGNDGFERAYDMGRILAETVNGTLETLTPSASFDIRHRWAHYACRAEESYLTFAYEFLGVPKRYIEYRDDEMWVSNIEVSWHKLGDAEFGVFPGEGTAEYSWRLRERMVSPQSFVVGLGNDSLGYIVDPESIEADPSGQLEGYELKMGLGRPAGPCAWDAMSSLGWFDGGYVGDED